MAHRGTLWYTVTHYGTLWHISHRIASHRAVVIWCNCLARGHLLYATCMDRTCSQETSHGTPGRSRPAWARRAAAASHRSEAGSSAAAMPSGRPWCQNTLQNMLQSFMLPAWWIELCLECAGVALRLPPLAAAEFFSGEAALAAAVTQEIGTCADVDIRHGQRHDVTRPPGQRLAATILLRLRCGAHVHLGTPCKSWAHMQQ